MFGELVEEEIRMWGRETREERLKRNVRELMGGQKRERDCMLEKGEGPVWERAIVEGKEVLDAGTEEVGEGERERREVEERILGLDCGEGGGKDEDEWEVLSVEGVVVSVEEVDVSGYSSESTDDDCESWDGEVLCGEGCEEVDLAMGECVGSMECARDFGDETDNFCEVETLVDIQEDEMEE